MGKNRGEKENEKAVEVTHLKKATFRGVQRSIHIQRAGHHSKKII